MVKCCEAEQDVMAISFAVFCTRGVSDSASDTLPYLHSTEALYSRIHNDCTVLKLAVEVAFVSYAYEHFESIVLHDLVR